MKRTQEPVKIYSARSEKPLSVMRTSCGYAGSTRTRIGGHLSTPQPKRNSPALVNCSSARSLLSIRVQYAHSEHMNSEHVNMRTVDAKDSVEENV